MTGLVTSPYISLGVKHTETEHLSARTNDTPFRCTYTVGLCSIFRGATDSRLSHTISEAIRKQRRIRRLPFSTTYSEERRVSETVDVSEGKSRNRRSTRSLGFSFIAETPQILVLSVPVYSELIQFLSVHRAVFVYNVQS